MTLDEYIAARSARDPEFAEALAVLRELVKPADIGLSDRFPRVCQFCQGQEEIDDRGALRMPHTPDCPIRKARELLARLASKEEGEDGRIELDEEPAND